MSEQEIDALRERWEAEKSPALTLQLADEYRRRNDPASALEVLRAALEATPDHVAARVAKGRCHLDLDDAEAARGELSRVVTDDPTHLLANKLLVDVHTRLGEAARARDRLGLFALLSGDRQEIDRLASLLSEPASDEPFELPAGEVPGALEMDSPGPAYPGRSRPRPAVRYADGEPFTLAIPDPASYSTALFGEGLFSQSAAWSGGESAPAGSEPVIDVTPPMGEEPTLPTLTLAELYRKQGHYEEAAGIFRDVLERQPGNLEAARALIEMEKEHSWPLSAEDLLGGAGDPNASDQTPSADEVLRRYRERLRGQG